MQVFSHLIASTCAGINAWCASSMNSLDSTLNNVESDIMSLEMSHCFIIDAHPHLLEMYAKYAALQR